MSKIIYQLFDVKQTDQQSREQAKSRLKIVQSNKDKIIKLIDESLESNKKAMKSLVETLSKIFRNYKEEHAYGIHGLDCLNGYDKSKEPTLVKILKIINTAGLYTEPITIETDETTNTSEQSHTQHTKKRRTAKSRTNESAAINEEIHTANEPTIEAPLEPNTIQEEDDWQAEAQEQPTIQGRKKRNSPTAETIAKKDDYYKRLNLRISQYMSIIKGAEQDPNELEELKKTLKIDQVNIHAIKGQKGQECLYWESELHESSGKNPKVCKWSTAIFFEKALESYLKKTKLHNISGHLFLQEKLPAMFEGREKYMIQV